MKPLSRMKNRGCGGRFIPLNECLMSVCADEKELRTSFFSMCMEQRLWFGLVWFGVGKISCCWERRSESCARGGETRIGAAMRSSSRESLFLFICRQPCSHRSMETVRTPRQSSIPTCGTPHSSWGIQYWWLRKDTFPCGFPLDVVPLNDDDMLHISSWSDRNRCTLGYHLSIYSCSTVNLTNLTCPVHICLQNLILPLMIDSQKDSHSHCDDK